MTGHVTLLEETQRALKIFARNSQRKRPLVRPWRWKIILNMIFVKQCWIRLPQG